MKFAPDYADRSPEAVLQWLEKTRIVYQAQAKGGHSAACIADHARERLPAIEAEIERVRRTLAPDLRVIDGGAS